MDPLILILAAFAVFIICTELMLWKLFRRRLVRICLPPQDDIKLVRFFTLRRLRIFIILHATIGCILFYALYFLLW